MKLLVVDSNSILNRAFYGIKLLTTKNGEYTNAVYGFFNIVLKLMEDLAPDQAAFAFDLPGGTFRHQMYDGYKAQRKGMPPELAQQLPVVKELIAAMGWPVVGAEGYEADDVLGTLARAAEGQGSEALLLTGDRDSLQLVDEKVTVILAATRAGGAQYLEMTPQAVAEKYGVAPVQLIDTKALMGDSSDNIPGVPGIGEKTAFALVQKYGSLDEIYRDVESLEVSAGVKKKLLAGKELALLSRELGTICCDAPVSRDLSDYARRPMDKGRLYAILSRLELHTLIARLGLEPPAPGEAEAGAGSAPQGEYALEAGEPDLAAIAGAEGPLYLAADWSGDGLETLAVSAGGRVWLAQKPRKELLLALNAMEKEKYLEDSKPWCKALLALEPGLREIPVAFDLRLAGYLLSPNSTEYSVHRLAGEYAVAAPALKALGEGEAPDAALRAAWLPALCRRLDEEIAANGQEELLHQMEIPLAQVLASMELEGFRVDLDGLAAFGEELRGLIDGLEQEIYDLAGHPFNINSPKQLGTVLFEELGLPTRKKTKSGYSTDAEVLESLIPYHAIISKILDYRKYAKLLSTYVEGLKNAASPDSRIRTSFNQTETRTGRISSAEPNLQNIPIRTEPGSRMRRFFTARDGCLLVDADYSQIELRVLASIAGDENMIAAFRSGEDIHRNTAAQVFDLPPDFVTPTMRSRAKAVNFGIVYGISAFSLSKDIGVSVAEADSYIKSYLRTYGGVKDYMDRAVKEAEEKGYAQTLFGRRRYLPELRSSNRNLRAFGQRVAMNMPIQGTAADIIKIAMVRVYRRLREENLRARLILQVHDELIVEAPEEEAPRVRDLVKEEMESAVSLAVPMEVDAKVGRDWGEAH